MKVDNFIVLIIGFLITSFILWNRLFRIRISKVFEQNTYDILLLLAIIISCITCIGIIIYSLRKILNILPKPNPWLIVILEHTYTSYILNIIRTYFTNAPRTLYEILYKQVPLKSFVETTGSYLVVNVASHINYWYLLFYLTPRILVVIVFVIDIVYFKQLHFFYKFVILLIIPLISTVYLFILYNLSSKNASFIQSHLEFSDSLKDPNSYNVSVKDVQPTFEGAWNLKDIDLDTVTLLWEIYSNIRNFSQYITEYRDKNKPYENLVIYSAYLIGWSYYLWFILDPSIDMFNFLSTIVNKEEPFSGLPLLYEYY
jgi:hypothetical protein